MKVLGIESSGQVASVSLVEDEILRGEFTINFKKTHSQTLLTMLDQMGKMMDLDLKTIDAIAVSGGPGSFTGLRIGTATAKGLGLALEKPLIFVPTVDGLAFNMWGYEGLICPIMDARRNQTYTGIYTFCEHKLHTIQSQCAIDIGQIVDKINTRNQKVVFLGDGVSVFTPYIEEHITVPFTFAPAHMNEQRAASVATLGLQLFLEGYYSSAADFKPDYLRLSQAERERKEKTGE